MKHEVTSLNTKKMFAQSLKKAMKSKPFSKITVSEIIADCGVNRKTFYYHFEDIYALLKWMFENEAIEVVKNFDLVVNYEEAIKFVMDYVDKNDYIINCVYDSIGRDEMKRFFYADFISIITSIIESTEKNFGILLEENYKKFLCEFYTEGTTGILVDWIKNKNIRNREKTIEYITSTFKSSLTGIFTEQINIRNSIKSSQNL